MRRIIITSMKVKNGNAYVSSNYIARGFDSLIMGMNLTITGGNTVKVDHGNVRITFELDGDDEELCSEILCGMFKDVIVEKL